MSIEVRAARAGEGGRLSEVFLESGRRAWAEELPGMAEVSSPPGDWEALIADPETICLVAEQDGEIAAFAVLCPSPDGGEDRVRVALLDRLYTAPSRWSRGLGAALLEASMEELAARGYREATLWTAEWNRARGFYESRGWSVDGATRTKTFAGGTYIEVRYRIPVRPSG